MSNLYRYPEKKRYLLDRGINEETIAKFGIFYQERWVKLHGTYYDHRIMIPIINRHGVEVGHTGRFIEDLEGKYLTNADRYHLRTMKDEYRGIKYKNTYNNDLFNKRKLLFNENNVLNGVQTVIVVESQMNVMALEQNRRTIKEAFVSVAFVATQGTAFTDEHLDFLLEKGVKEILFIFDNDKAGVEATLKATRLIATSTSNITISVSFPPKGHDLMDIINHSSIFSTVFNSFTELDFWDMYATKHYSNSPVMLSKFFEDLVRGLRKDRVYINTRREGGIFLKHFKERVY